MDILSWHASKSYFHCTQSLLQYSQYRCPGPHCFMMLSSINTCAVHSLLFSSYLFFHIPCALLANLALHYYLKGLMQSKADHASLFFSRSLTPRHQALELTTHTPMRNLDSLTMRIPSWARRRSPLLPPPLRSLTRCSMTSCSSSRRAPTHFTTLSLAASSCVKVSWPLKIQEYKRRPASKALLNSFSSYLVQ